MSKTPDEEAPQIYYIPTNYDNSGGVLGGRIKTRNAIELVVFCGPIAWLEYHLLRFSVQTNIIIFLVTLVPLGALCIFGVSGESLSQILFSLIRYKRNQRTLHYDMFTHTDDLDQKKFSLDKFLDVAASAGIKAALQKFSDERADMNESKDKTAKKKPKKRRRRGESSEDEETIREVRDELRRQERAITGQTKGWMSAAKKDKRHTTANNPTSGKKKKKGKSKSSKR